MSEPVHEHPLVLIEEGEYGFTVRWCRECGMLYKQVGGIGYAVMIPEWSKARLEATPSEVFNFGSYKVGREESTKKKKSKPAPLDMDPLFPPP